MGEQLQPAAERADRRQRHVHPRHRRAAAHPPDGLSASASSSRGSATSRASTTASFGIEKRAGGHVFQLNFSNGFGTTMGQLARGGTGSEDWYLGFNISRKFF